MSQLYSITTKFTISVYHLAAATSTCTAPIVTYNSGLMTVPAMQVLCLGRGIRRQAGLVAQPARAHP